jgi:hypothetical protein
MLIDAVTARASRWGGRGRRGIDRMTAARSERLVAPGSFA